MKNEQGDSLEFGKEALPNQEAINAQNILEREVEFFLNTLKDRHAFIVR